MADLPVNYSDINLLSSPPSFLDFFLLFFIFDEKVRRIDQLRRLSKSQSRESRGSSDHVGSAQDHIFRRELQASAAAFSFRQHESQQ